MTELEAAFTEDRGLLWGLGYRMLGVASEADEVVQDAFVRALRARPDPTRPLRPWLVRVTLNLARDRLRRRRRAEYPGPWLPQPVAVEPPGSERLEQVSYALLVALERLTPTQRAVWLLREVMDLDTAEAADVLEVQPGSVKVALHRARRALDGTAVEPADVQTSFAAVGELAHAIMAGDVAAVVALLADAPAAVLRAVAGVAMGLGKTVVEGWFAPPDEVAPLFAAGSRSTTLPMVRGPDAIRTAWLSSADYF